jgi:hypothetical protein
MRHRAARHRRCRHRLGLAKKPRWKMNSLYQYILWFSIFSTGVGCGVYAGVKIADGEKQGLFDRWQNAIKERDEWQKRHADLMEQWEREKRPRPFRATEPEKQALLDHDSWGAP